MVHRKSCFHLLPCSGDDFSERVFFSRRIRCPSFPLNLLTYSHFHLAPKLAIASGASQKSRWKKYAKDSARRYSAFRFGHVCTTAIGASAWHALRENTHDLPRDFNHRCHRENRHFRFRVQNKELRKITLARNSVLCPFGRTSVVAVLSPDLRLHWPDTRAVFRPFACDFCHALHDILRGHQ